MSYTDDMQAGITDVTKFYYPLNFHVDTEIMDSNTDLIKVDIGNIAFNQLRKVIVTSPVPADSNGTMEVRTSADGGGSGIAVSITKGASFHSNTGDINSTTFFWVRSVTPFFSGNVTIQLIFEMPLVVFPI